MSIDLDWSLIDDESNSRTLSSINAALANTNRPGFLGDIRVTSLSFGSVAPELELIEIRDVFEEFLNLEHDDEDLLSGPANGEAGDGRRQSSPSTSLASSSYFAGRPPLATPTLFSNTHAGLWMAASSSHRASVASGATTPGFPFPRNLTGQAGGYLGLGSRSVDADRRSAASSSVFGGPGDFLQRHRDASPSAAPGADPSSGLSLQLHFRISYAGDMHLCLQTAIQVNYPSRTFMSLPLTMSVTGIIFEGTLVVAYEGDRKRLHVCLLDDAKHEAAKGHRLLRDVCVQSEMGHADKLVLKDLEKVEDFVLEAARKALEVSSWGPAAILHDTRTRTQSR